jgi:4-amino-4-deoxy-L-arabinose transferase-like glycosyltransferase
VISTSLFNAARGRLDRAVNAFIDPKQRDRVIFAALAAYLLIWMLYGVISKSNQDIHTDMSELVAWSRDLALGFPKHPPFAAVVVRGWFALLPITDWSFYLLAILTATLALWIAWQQFADYLDPSKRLVALCLMTFIPFFNFHALKFNVNTLLMPLWAVTTLWFLRSYRTRNAAYAALAGGAAAFCMLTKYWSFFLVTGLVVAALTDSRRAVYFRSPAPYLTVLVGVAILSPHVGWLEKHDFSPMEYAMAVHGGHAFGEAVWADLRYVADSLAYVAAPIAFVFLLARPDRRAIMDMVWPSDPDRRLVAVAFWATLLLPTVPGLLWGIEIHGIWSMSSWTLLPVLLLSPPGIHLQDSAVRLIAATAIVFPVVMLLSAPAVALFFHQRGIPPQLAHSRMLAEQVEQAWRETTDKPLRYVGGDFAEGVLTYIRSRPELMPDFSQWRTKRVRESGIAFVCFAEDKGCITSSRTIADENSASRKIETVLVRNFFGIPGAPQRYVIFIMPPQWQ